VPGMRATFAREHEDKRHGTVTLLASMVLAVDGWASARSAVVARSGHGTASRVGTGGHPRRHT
jgi:hypothetical protein